MIILKDLIKTYGPQEAVNIPDLTIENGTLLGLVGNNGAGKTTLFRLILDLVEATEGCVSIAERADSSPINPAKSEEWKTFTGAYIGDGYLIDFLSTEEYFSFIAELHNISQEQLSTTIEEYSDFLTTEILGTGKLIRDLSAGNKQKVGIVAALLSHPSLIVLDEPFNFLDPSSQNSLKRLLTNYHSTTGATIIISSHNLTHTIDISTHIALMEHGKVIEYIENTDGAARSRLEEYFA